MAKLTQILTAKGTALYPHIRRPETYQGKEVGYTIQMQFNKKDTDALVARLEQELAAAKKSSEFAGKKWSKEPNMGIKYDKNEDVVFKFKTNTTIKTKTGEVINRNIPVFDAMGNPYKGDIGHGSVCRVRFSVNPYHASGTNNGLSLYLDAVQVIELVEPNSGNAASYGFDKEDGFNAASANNMEEDVPEFNDTDPEEDF